MPGFFDPHEFNRPYWCRRWPCLPPHGLNGDTTQAPDFNMVEFIIFTGSILSIAVLITFFQRYCLNQRAARPQQIQNEPNNGLEMQPLNAEQPAYGAV